MDSHDRGVSEVLGYVLVFSLVLASVVVVSVVGVGNLETARDTEQMNNAVQAFDLLATNMDDIARRGAPSRSTEMQIVNGQLSVPESITVTFRAIDDQDSANNFSESYSIRPIRYSGGNSDEEVVYVNGAVFRTNPRGGVLVREPSIVAENDHVFVPMIHTRSSSIQSRSGGTARVRAKHAQTILLASDTDDTYETVFMNITSDRAPIWVDTLDEYAAFTCSLDASGGTDRAVCEADPKRLHIALVQVDVELND